MAPQARADDGYIYPADGSSNEARYPAPPGRRPTARKSINSHSSNITIIAATPRAPQGYYNQPRPYYQQRGLFSSQD